MASSTQKRGDHCQSLSSFINAQLQKECDPGPSQLHHLSSPVNLKSCFSIKLSKASVIQAGGGRFLWCSEEAIFDVFRGQNVDRVHEILEENRIMVVLVKSTCTDQLQPLDLFVNKPAKDFLKRTFAQWYSDKVTEQFSSEKHSDEVSVDVYSREGSRSKLAGVYVQLCSKQSTYLHKWFQEGWHSRGYCHLSKHFPNGATC